MFSRRTLIGASLAATAAAVTGCAPGEQPAASVPSGETVSLPIHQTYSGVTPDKAGSADGIVQNYFVNYPKELPTAFDTAPIASGEPVSIMVPLDSAITPPPMGQNPFFTALQKRLGAPVTMQLPPSSQYQEKVAVLLAGNDIPDVMHIRLSIAPQRLPQLLEARFADLTPYLSGDAIAQFPSLAALPTASWKGAVFNNKLFGVARTVPLARWFLYQRTDLTKPIISDPAITSGDQFLEACRAVTNRDKHQFATASPDTLVTMFHLMKGGSNVWGEKDGAFISAYEEPQYRAALELVRTMWADGLIHPESFANPVPHDWFGTGEIRFWYSASDPVLMKRRYLLGAPDYENTRQLPPGWAAGTKAVYPLENPTNGITVIRKGLPDTRVRELLSMINYLAAPFGTEEYRFVTYGVEGQDFTLQGTNPFLTAQGQNEVNPIQLGNITRPAPVLYAPDYPEIVAATQAMQVEAEPNAVFGAHIGLYSETALNKTTSLDRTIADIRADVIQGRRDMSAWDTAVAGWRSEGGDQIRTEYQEAANQR